MTISVRELGMPMTVVRLSAKTARPWRAHGSRACVVDGSMTIARFAHGDGRFVGVAT